MPRFFFHIDDGRFMRDETGTELEGIADARSQAVIAAGEFLAETDGKFWDHGQPWRMQVTDEHDRLLFTLRFSAEVPSGEIIFQPRGRAEQDDD
mgnify:CR=1 FL=1